MLVAEIIHNKYDEHGTSYMLSSRIDQNGHNYNIFHRKAISLAANTDPLDPNTSKTPE